ncbi:MAG TPA: ABC transporter ATP-binding protein [Candidatus Limnocylindria bacterium]
MTTAISIEGVSKRYRGVAALTELSLQVPSGSIYGFLGPNGAGKTTALKILAGLARASDGQARVAGIPVDLQGAHRTQVGYLAQEPRFYGWMTGRQTLAYVGSFYPDVQTRDRTDELLDLVGLTDAADRPTKTYSGGMRQRLGIAQALAGNPPVLLLDEPAASLDPVGRHDVLELMRRLRGDKTIFYSTHILDDVQRVSDYVAIVDQGRLVTAAPTATLVSDATGESISVALIGADDETQAALATLPGVSHVRSTGRAGDEWRYEVIPVAGGVAAAQAAVTRYAADAGVTVACNRPEAMDLEQIFLRIVNKERAA